MSARLVSVVVPCRNSERTVARLVAELQRQTLPAETSIEIVAVDNGSTDSTAAILRGLPVRLVDAPTPGPAAARNAGVRASRGEVVVFMDSDTRPMNPGFVAAHLANVDANPDTGISGGPIVHDIEQRSVLAFAENATALFNWHDRLPARDLTFQPAGNMAFRRALFDRIGPLDESLRTLEDFDWNQRAIRAGFKVRFVPDAGVYITGRESLRAILAKFYTWGLNVRSVYLPGRREQVWLFPDHPVLFYLNVPFRLLNETWVTMKRWFPVCPAKTILLTPLFLLYRAAWASGIAAGAARHGGAR